jgi:hypothetical protein
MRWKAKSLTNNVFATGLDRHHALHFIENGVDDLNL